MSKRFDGKSILVTGAGGGIGRATAMLVRRGRRAPDARRPQRGRRKRDRARSRKGRWRGRCHPRRCSRAAPTVAPWSKEALATYGRDRRGLQQCRRRRQRLSHCRGRGHAWDRIVDTNLKGVYLSMKYEIPADAEDRRRYHRQHRLGRRADRRTRYRELRRIEAWRRRAHPSDRDRLHPSGHPHKCRVPRCDAHADARAIGSRIPRSRKFVIGRHPIGRACEPEEIGRAVLFLASDDASYIVGHALAVDGGLTAQ